VQVVLSHRRSDSGRKADALKARGAVGVAASRGDLYRLVHEALSRPAA
jgi:hypothetical protein